MAKTITDNQILGELGETAIKKIVLEMHFIYDHRGRLEAGTDGIMELRDPQSGAPLGKLLGVQVKSTKSSKYAHETDRGFEYLMRPDDLKYWRTSNIPVILVVWRESDGSAYWKDVTDCVRGDERRVRFDKVADVFDKRCADRLGDLTIDRRTPGVYLPPLNLGEEALINLLRIKLPDEIFVATSPFGNGPDAVPELVKHDDARFDWVIRNRRFISFFDPRECGTRAIVDLDQVEAVDTSLVAFNDDLDDRINMMDLLRRTIERQTSTQLWYLKDDRLFFFRARGRRTGGVVISIGPRSMRPRPRSSACTRTVRSPNGVMYAITRPASGSSYWPMSGSLSSIRPSISRGTGSSHTVIQGRSSPAKSAWNAMPLFAAKSSCGDTYSLRAANPMKVCSRYRQPGADPVVRGAAAHPAPPSSARSVVDPH